jgi:hypothetical protein
VRGSRGPDPGAHELGVSGAGALLGAALWTPTPVPPDAPAAPGIGSGGGRPAGCGRCLRRTTRRPELSRLEAVGPGPSRQPERPTAAPRPASRQVGRRLVETPQAPRCARAGGHRGLERSGCVAGRVRVADRPADGRAGRDRRAPAPCAGGSHWGVRPSRRRTRRRVCGRRREAGGAATFCNREEDARSKRRTVAPDRRRTRPSTRRSARSSRRHSSLPVARCVPSASTPTGRARRPCTGSSTSCTRTTGSLRPRPTC